MKKEFEEHLEKYDPFIKAILELFHPLIEVAIHDLTDGKLVAIYHNISKRKIGENSPLNELKINTEDFPDYFNPYYKKNWNGRELKCTSITIRDEKRKAIGLICINVDISFAKDTKHFLENFLKIKQEAENPIEIFGNQCEEQTEYFIQQYLEDKNLSLKHINNKHKQELVQYLYCKGVFNFKNATPYIATYLNISRATIYNYIKQLGG